MLLSFSIFSTYYVFYLAPTYQDEFLVCANLLGNKFDSDSEKAESDPDPTRPLQAHVIRPPPHNSSFVSLQDEWIKSSQLHLYSLISKITNLPQEVLQPVQHTTPSVLRALIQIKKLL